MTTFMLLDVDVGGVPTECHGVVRPGEAVGLNLGVVIKPVGKLIRPCGPAEDEPDWEGNPETALLLHSV